MKPACSSQTSVCALRSAPPPHGSCVKTTKRKRETFSCNKWRLTKKNSRLSPCSRERVFVFLAFTRCSARACLKQRSALVPSVGRTSPNPTSRNCSDDFETERGGRCPFPALLLSAEGTCWRGEERRGHAVRVVVLGSEAETSPPLSLRCFLSPTGVGRIGTIRD